MGDDGEATCLLLGRDRVRSEVPCGLNRGERTSEEAEGPQPSTWHPAPQHLAAEWGGDLAEPVEKAALAGAPAWGVGWERPWGERRPLGWQSGDC